MGLEAIQIRLLDTVGPLASLHVSCHDAITKKQALDPRGVLEAVNNAITLIGNSNSQICYERRRTILRKINPELGSYANKGGLNSNSTELFGEGLRKTIKESVDLTKEVAGFARLSNTSGNFILSYIWLPNQIIMPKLIKV